MRTNSLQAGRSSYVSEDLLASAPDPGAMAAAYWYRAAALAMKDNYKVVWGHVGQSRYTFILPFAAS